MPGELFRRGLPVRGVAVEGFEGVGGEQSLVAQAGQGRLGDGGQGVAQEAQGGVAIGLLQRFAAEAFGRADVEPIVSGRVVPRGPTERRLVAVQDHEEERGGASAVALLPGGGTLARRGALLAVATTTSSPALPLPKARPTGSNGVFSGRVTCRRSPSRKAGAGMGGSAERASNGWVFR